MSSAVTNRRSPGRGERGFSVIELLVVMAILAIMLTVAIFSLPTQKKSLAVDFTSAQVIDLLRFANQRALAERQVMRLEITASTDTTPGQIVVIDQETLAGGTGDDTVIRTETLVPKAEVAIATATSTLNLPPIPFNFNWAQFTSNKLTLYFSPDGLVTNAAGTVPQSMSLLFYTPLPDGKPDPALTRAATIFGPTSSVRPWYFDSNTNNFVELN